MTIEELKAAYIAATDKLEAVNKEMRAETYAARTKIEEAFRDRVYAASVDATAAHRQLLVAEAEAVALKAKTHPLVGRKVACVRRKRSSMWARDMADLYGVIEVITEDSEQPEGTRGTYRRLKHGTVAVRILKADGKPGKTVETYVSRDAKREQMATNSYYASMTEEAKERQLQAFWKLVD